MDTMNYQQPIYIIATDHRTGRNVAKEMTIADYLREYCSDETTTPKGVAPRLHIRENEEAETFEVWTWGVAGNNPRKLNDYPSEEEAREAILYSWYWDWSEGKCKDTPPTWNSLEVLFQDAAEDGETVLTEKENEVVLAQEADREQREKARAAKYETLIGDHKAVLLEWWKSKEYHPAPKAVMQAKEQTGMTWKEIRNYCKANAQ